MAVWHYFLQGMERVCGAKFYIFAQNCEIWGSRIAKFSKFTTGGIYILQFWKRNRGAKFYNRLIKGAKPRSLPTSYTPPPPPPPPPPPHPTRISPPQLLNCTYTFGALSFWWNAINLSISFKFHSAHQNCVSVPESFLGQGQHGPVTRWSFHIVDPTPAGGWEVTPPAKPCHWCWSPGGRLSGWDAVTMESIVEDYNGGRGWGWGQAWEHREEEHNVPDGDS